MTGYQGYCNDCQWYGKSETTPEAARFDALEHSGDASHNDVEVQRAPSEGNPMFVMWRSTDGLGEDGQSHISSS